MNIIGKNTGYIVNDVVYGDGGTCGPRIQPNLQLVYVFRGSCHIDAGDKSFELEEGQATLLLPGRVEYFVFAPDTCHGWSQACNAQLSPEAFNIIDSLPQCVAVSKRLEELHRMAMTCAGSLQPAEQSLQESLAESILACFLADAGASLTPNPPLPTAVERALDLIHNHYQEPLDLDALAVAAAISGPHLIRLFKEHLSTTPIRYLWQIRTREAINLLRNTGLGISEIAYRCGFQTPYHFSRVVRETAGASPRQVRHAAWSHPKVSE